MPDGKRQAGLPEALPGATETRVSAPGWKAGPGGAPDGGECHPMEWNEMEEGKGTQVAGQTLLDPLRRRSRWQDRQRCPQWQMPAPSL